MNNEMQVDLQQLQTVTQARLDALVLALSKKARVVNEDALEHLIKRGVLAPMARDGCCKPDGGTCCPNAKLRMLPERPTAA